MLNSNVLSNHPIHALNRESEFDGSKDITREHVGYLGIIHPPVSDDLTSIGAVSSEAMGSGAPSLLQGLPLTSNYFRRAHKL